jgi:predicted ester cyclase
MRVDENVVGVRGGSELREGVRVSEANKEIVRRYQEAYNTNNLDVLDEVLHPDWQTNAWPDVIPKSIENAKEFYRGALESLPDYQTITLDLIAEDDWVVQRHLIRATFKGELAGLSPTGRVVETGGISMFRIADGRIVEHWAYADDAGFWEQLGVEVPELMRAFAHRSPTRGTD